MRSGPSPRSKQAALLSRRDFLAQACLGVAVGSVGAVGWAPVAEAASTGSALVGSELYGWGQYHQREGKNLSDHLDEVFGALRDAGYDYAEGTLDVGQPENNAHFADRLRAKGLQPVSLYTGGHLHQAEQSRAVVARILAAAKVCRDAGFRVLVCNPDPIGREKTDAELATQAAALDDLGRGLRELGLLLGVHNHTPEMVHQAREFHYDMDHTKPRLVGLCLDVHWVYRGGLDPLQALHQYGARVVSWHLRQSRGSIWWEDLDTGDVDYSAIAAYARAHHLAQRYSVELALENGTKITRSVVENHRRSREFIRKVFGC